MRHDDFDDPSRRTTRPSCECGEHLICRANAPRGKRGFRRLAKHDLCWRCYPAELDRLKSAGCRSRVRPQHRQRNGCGLVTVLADRLAHRRASQ
jgi:hypothetical protein